MIGSPSCAGLIAGNFLQQLTDDIVGGFAFGIRLEGANQAVSQDQGRQCGHILTGDVESPLTSGTGSAGQDQVLAGARAGSPANPALDVIGTFAVAAGARRPAARFVRFLGGATLRHPADVWLMFATVAFIVVALTSPNPLTIGVGIWWLLNTVSHNFIHQPFFTGRAANRLFAIYLSLLTLVPHRFWRDKHLAHHADRIWQLRFSRDLLIDAYGDPGEDYPLDMTYREGRMSRITVDDVRAMLVRWQERYAPGRATFLQGLLYQKEHL